MGSGIDAQSPSPYFRAIFTAHRRLDDDRAFVALFQWQCADQRGRNHAGGDDNRFGFDCPAVGKDDFPRLHMFDFGFRADLHSTAAQNLCDVIRELIVKLRGEPRANFDQLEAQVGFVYVWIKPRHVWKKFGQLANQFDADKSSADDHKRQCRPPLGLIRLRISALEPLDRMIPQENRIAHGFERQPVLRPRNHAVSVIPPRARTKWSYSISLGSFPSR